MVFILYLLYQNSLCSNTLYVPSNQTMHVSLHLYMCAMNVSVLPCVDQMFEHKPLYFLLSELSQIKNGSGSFIFYFFFCCRLCHAQQGMHIDVEAVSSLCFVMTKLYLRRLLRNQLVYPWPKRTSETIRGVQTAKLKVLSFAPLALVRAYMWTLYWRVRESSSKFAAQVNSLF